MIVDDNLLQHEVINLISQVKVLQGLNAQELKLLKDCENFSLLPMQIDMDKFTRFLPLHLTAVLLSPQRDEASLRYLLSGLRLLYSLFEIASHHPKLEQVSLFLPYPFFQLDARAVFPKVVAVITWLGLQPSLMMHVTNFEFYV